MRLAKEIATLSHQSGLEWNIRFGRTRKSISDTSDPVFQIENYLSYQGKLHADRIDPNSLIYLLKASELFDASEEFGTMNEALSKVKCPVLIIGAQTDILCPIEKQRQLTTELRNSGNHYVSYLETNSSYGIYFNRLIKLFVF